MNAALLALAFLCGVPVGFIVGLLVVWQMTRPQPAEPDYSDGY